MNVLPESLVLKEAFNRLKSLEKYWRTEEKATQGKEGIDKLCHTRNLYHVFIFIKAMR